jgi:glycosyltransferase involved in cell wall biosynthesis
VNVESISILIPTLNAGRVLEGCLQSITNQDYPKDLVEIIIADGGSTDKTLEIARKYTNKIYPNPLKTGEAGKAEALKHASGDIIALIDSDNILPSLDWLKRMTEPFEDKEIVGAEPLEYTYRKEDGYITRYCALMGMNDPLCLFLGNYDRYNTITGTWTEMPVEVEDMEDYLKVTVNERQLPTIGANGFLIRRNDLMQTSVENYLFDIDVVYELALQDKKKYAKVKTGIVHLFSEDMRTFMLKQQRRIRDFLCFKEQNLRSYPWSNLNKIRLARFVVYTVLIVPLIAQVARGYRKVPDRSWWFHFAACWITLIAYTIGLLSSLVNPKAPSRVEWSQ